MKVPTVSAEADDAPGQLERLFLKDPAMTAELFSQAKSALVGRRRPVITVKEAILHMGCEFTKSLACTLSMRGYVESVQSTQASFAIWSHSIATAVVADYLNRRPSLTRPRESFRDVEPMGCEMPIATHEPSPPNICQPFGDSLEQAAFMVMGIAHVEQHRNSPTQTLDQSDSNSCSACGIATKLGYPGAVAPKAEGKADCTGLTTFEIVQLQSLIRKVLKALG